MTRSQLPFLTITRLMVNEIAHGVEEYVQVTGSLITLQILDFFADKLSWKYNVLVLH